MKSLPEQTVELWGGMECTINRVGDEYFDQLDHSGHRERTDDITLFAGLGFKKMRYPVLWEHHQPQKDLPVNWQATDEKLKALRSSGIEVIAGLVHHGSGPVHAPIDEETFVSGLAAFALQVAEKFPWINYYTPVNEPLTTARFCGLYGIWYPHTRNDNSFCRILVNECKATALAMAAIRSINPAAKLVQTDDLAKIHSTAHLQYQADFENERRWLSFDLLCGKVDRHHALRPYLTEHGIGESELEYFIHHPCPPDILGVNYYLTSERYLDEHTGDYPAHTHGGNGREAYADVEAVRVGNAKPDGLAVLLKEAWRRYRIPVAITEVHLHCTREEQMRWLNESWQTAKQLCQEGIPIIAITPWALLGSFGWDRLLTSAGGTYEPGVFDCSCGYLRPTVLAAMIRAFARDKNFQHPALDQPGWWKRPCRVAYGEKQTSLITSGRSVAISGYRVQELRQICHDRGLRTQHRSDLGLNDADIWAWIIADEHLQIRCDRQNDLIVRLSGDLRADLNAGLDLLLDGESGFWAANADGSLKRLIADQLSALSHE